MKITYIYHSGFAVDLEDCVLIFDYSGGRLPHIAENRKVFVFASHRHGDHFQDVIFEWKDRYPGIRYILSEDIPADRAPDRIFLGPDQECDVGGIRIKTLRSTDEGVAFFVSVRTASSIRHIYHAGDLNWWHWEEESDAWNREMARAYQLALEPIADSHIDAAFVPVDPRLGEAYYWGLDWFMRHTATDLVFPMHMWGSYEILDRLFQQPETEAYRENIVRLREEDECR